MADIVCVGILCADVLGKPIDEFPEKGRLEVVESLSLRMGGCAANVAVCLAKIGLASSLIGKIGEDGFGRLVRETLRAEKVDTRGLVVGRSTHTFASMLLIGRDGERTILHCLGANAAFSFEDIDLEIVKKAKILMIAGTFLMPSFDGRGTEKLLKIAQKAGVVCCLDTHWDTSGRWLKKIGASLPSLDWFLPSYDEACQMSGKTDPDEIARDFSRRGAKNVIVKLGADGCFVKPAQEKGFFVPAYKNIEVVDATGAGDAFCAGFVAGLVMGWDIKECARFANAVGAHCVMAIGTTAGIKSLPEIQAFMNAAG